MAHSTENSTKSFFADVACSINPWSTPKETPEETIARLKKELNRYKSGLEVVELQEEIEKLKKQKQEAIDKAAEVIKTFTKLKKELKYETDLYEKRLKEEYDLKKKTLEAENRIDKADLIAELREASEVRVDELKQAAIDSNARFEEFRNVVDAYKEQNNDLKGIIADLLKKLPSVDLSKFNVNVEVPQTSVTIKK